MSQADGGPRLFAHEPRQTPRDIHHLPDEVLLMVIKAHFHDSEVEEGWGDPWSNIRAPLRNSEWMAVMSVCKLWRDLVCSTGTLWSAICIEGNVEWLGVRLSRAGHSPVDLYVWADLETEPPCSSLDVLARRSPHVRSISFVYEIPETLQENTCSWEAFHHALYAGCASTATSVLYNAGPPTTTLNPFLLQSLETERLPHITTMVIVGSGPPTSPALYARLEVLELLTAWQDDDDYAWPTSWESIRAILSPFIGRDPANPPVIFLPHLESLTLLGNDSRAPFLCAAFLSTLRLPALVELLMEDNLSRMIETNLHLEYSFDEMLPATYYHHNLHTGFPALRGLNAMSIRSTTLTYSLVLREQATAEPPPATPATAFGQADVRPHPLVHLVLCEDESTSEHTAYQERFHRLLHGVVCGAAPVVVGLPITALTLDVTHSDVDSADPWMELFVALPALAALHIAGSMGCGAALAALATDGLPRRAMEESEQAQAAAAAATGAAVCLLLTRLRIGGPHAMVTADDSTFRTLEEMLEWRAAHGAARIEELEVGLLHEGRTGFTSEDEHYLCLYLARYSPDGKGRAGNKLYQVLVENPERKWKWSQRHTWQSWRGHYVHADNRARMDKKIALLVKRAQQSQSGTPGSSTSAPSPTSASRRTIQTPQAQVDYTNMDNQTLIQHPLSSGPSRGSHLGLGLKNVCVSLCLLRTFGSPLAVEQREAGDDEDIPMPKGAVTTVKDYVARRPSSQRAKPAPADKRKRVRDIQDEAPPKKKIRVDVEAMPPRKKPSSVRRGSGGGAPVEASGDEEDGAVDIPQTQQEAHLDISGRDVDDVEEARDPATASEASDEEVETLKMLTDQPILRDELDERHDDDVGDNSFANPTVVGPRVVEVAEAVEGVIPVVEELRTKRSDAFASGASPPRRKSHERPRPEAEAAPNPPISPTPDRAKERHHRERSHSPAPRRKHPRRIHHQKREEITFATPEPEASSSSVPPSTGSSPTAQVSKRRNSQPDAPCDPSPRLKEPPRLDEGAFNKALSDAKGKTRVELGGKARRRNIEDEPETSDMEDTLEDDEPAPVPARQVSAWPPVRGGTRRDPGPSTPARASRADGNARLPSSSQIVTTETVIVQRTRTVERKVPRGSKRTPFPRSARAPTAVEPPSSPVQQPVDDDLKADEIDVDRPQHHPFSQPHHPFSQPLSQPVFAPRLGAFSRANSTSSAPSLPLIPGRNDAKPNLEQLLNADRKRPLTAPSNMGHDAKRPKSTGPLPPLNGARLESLLDAGRSHGELPSGAEASGAERRSTLSAKLPSGKHTGVHFERIADHSMPQPCSLVDKGDSHSSHQSFDDLKPQESSSRIEMPAPLPQPSKSVGHTRRHSLGASVTPDIFYDHPARHSTDPRARRTSSGLQSGSSLGSDGLSRENSFQFLFPSARTITLPPASAYLPGAGTSLSSPRAADARFVNTVPPAERELLQAYVMQLVVQTMAQNHGFHEDIVRRLCEETRSFAKADRRLLAMREGASEALDRFDDSDEEAGAQEEKDGEAGTVSGASDASNRTGSKDAAEVEGVLSQDRWLRGELPQAESTRIQASPPPAVPQRGRVSFGGRGLLRITPVAADSESSVDVDYSPPKTSRAHRHLRELQRSGEDPVDAGVELPAVDRVKWKGRAEEVREVDLKDMLSYGKEDWCRLERIDGPGGAKKAFGKALAKLL
ncbi:uncharacterized protein BXZ73DRAFT_107116 [Epithele typhae]|uniref:uncharacterized protein n=1 Tax=Epithele typhae TaxID=378194 RepID=UPI002008DE42|nr:uncharacterized protein BXZ73DRAFT_107116 [Epithele typhae]KAH9912971.1 hypothetical protein BXZ73DRAFT_107116 [Epithele typhae]